MRGLHRQKSRGKFVSLSLPFLYHFLIFHSLCVPNDSQEAGIVRGKTHKNLMILEKGAAAKCVCGVNAVQPLLE